MLNLEGIGQRAIAKVVNKAIEYSPQIAFVAGAACVVGGVVLACKATIKAQKVKEELEETKKVIEETSKAAEENEAVSYTEEDAAKDLKVANGKAVVGYVKQYALPAVAVAVGIGLMYYSSATFYHRGLGYLAAYESLNKEFDAYRKRTELLLGDTASIDHIEVVDKEGNKTVKSFETTPYEDDVLRYGRYAKIFSRLTVGDACVSIPDYAGRVCAGAETSFNADINASADGIISLYELYSYLGFKPYDKQEKAEWMVMGWDRNDPNFKGIKITVVPMEPDSFGHRWIISPNVQPRPIIMIPSACFGGK